MQEFLGIIDVSFNDKVCRTSFLPQSDPLPRTIADVYEGAHITAPRVEAYHRLSADVAMRLERMQSHTAAMDEDMGDSNPPIFAAVQVGRIRACSAPPMRSRLPS